MQSHVRVIRRSQLAPVLQAARAAAGTLFSFSVPPIFRHLLIPLSVAFGYYLGSKVGFFLTPKGSAIATYWPPNAILLASFLLVAPRRWWVLTLAALGAHLLVQVQSGVPLPTLFGWFIGNTSEALLGAALLYRFNKRMLLFNSVRGTLFFLLFGVVLAPLVTSFLDAAVVVGTGWGTGYWTLWMTRLFSNMLAVLTIVPAIVTFGTSAVEWRRKVTAPRLFELLMLAASLIPVTLLAYGGHNPPPSLVPALVYVPLPFLLWASLRFGAGYVAASVATIAVISFHYVMQGRGPFVSALMTENVLFLQLLLGIVTVPLLLLSAVLSERQRTEHELRENRAMLVNAQEEERHRIARELHDDIGQQLLVVELELRRLQAGGEQHESSSNLGQSAEKLAAQIAAISEATRGLSHGLHPAQLEYLGLVPALRSFCAELQLKASMEISLAEKTPLPQLDSDISLCLFRVAQEGLHNVVKYSHAKSAWAELSVEENRILLRIIDDGVGFTPGQEHAGGLGLINMRERVKSAGGTLKVSSAVMKGTVIQASVPLKQAPRA